MIAIGLIAASLAWVGGRSSPSRSFLLRRRTDRRHRTRAPKSPTPGGISSLSSTSPVRGCDRPQIALVTFPGHMPELSVEPGDPGDEAVGLDRAKNRPCFGIDLIAFSGPDISPTESVPSAHASPEPLPSGAGIVASTRPVCGSIFWIQILGELKQVLAVEGRSRRARRHRSSAPFSRSRNRRRSACRQQQTRRADRHR